LTRQDQRFCFSYSVVNGLRRTLLLSGAPPKMHDMKQRRNRRVH
jgi:hypothetical protein